MTDPMELLEAKLRRTVFDDDSNRAPYQKLVNPDGPEAADAIASLRETVRVLREAGQKARGALADPVVGTIYQDDPDWYCAVNDAIAAIDAVLIPSEPTP